jgi:hypothetical protein
MCGAFIRYFNMIESDVYLCFTNWTLASGVWGPYRRGNAGPSANSIGAAAPLATFIAALERVSPATGWPSQASESVVSPIANISGSPGTERSGPTDGFAVLARAL